MNKWVKRKWVKALRSGEYRQGYRSLGSQGKYCCLGVLVCEMVPELSGQDTGLVGVNGNRHYIPDDLGLLYGLDQNTIKKLADLNDRSPTFEPVIAYIEKYL